jgi:zinc protease
MKFFMRTLAALAMFGAGGASAAPAQSASAPAPAAATKATQFTLENGMQVVVIEDHRAPVVTHMVWFRVGGADDPPGISGAAHLFEHLMFKGTKTVPNGELSRIVARNGGQDNAFTTNDFTAYFERIAKDRLGIMMGLDADRMVNLDLSEENVTTERSVVLEERRLRVESNPDALAQEQMEAALHYSHPYGRPVIGWLAEISTMTRAQAIDFYEHHYAPNNATLIVAGDVTPAEVKKLAEENYGKVPAKMLAPRPNIPPPPRLAESRMDFAIPGTNLAQLMRFYRVASYGKREKGTAESLDVLSAVLGGGETSRLYRTLVVEKKLAVDTGAFYDGHKRGPGELGVYAVPAEGVSFDTLEKAMDEVIASMEAAPPAAEELESAKTRLVAEHIYQNDNQFLLGQDYGTGLSIGLSIADIEDWPNRIRAVKGDDVKTAAQKFLVRNEAVTGRMSPEPRGH